MTRRAIVRGVGHYLPERVVSNSEFETTLDTSDEWIRSRSGIERRHFAAEGQTTSDMAARAASAALKDAGFDVGAIDALIVATSTADLTFPSAATMVQSEIGMPNGFAFDVQAVCAGFVFALANANALIVSGQVERVLLKDGRSFDVDIVVMAVGIRPSSDLAKSVSLDVGRGVQVSDDMRTSDPDIFALGECVEHRGMC